MNFTTTVATPVGPFTIVAGESEAVRAAGFTADVARLLELLPPAWRTAPEHRRHLGDASTAVAAYLAGDLTALDTVAVEPPGNGFLAEAWQAMRKVPAGRTRSYTALAADAGRPPAVRAAANACARNPAALIVPCHRVVRADGSLGGYRWGLPVKRWLLSHEGAPGR